MSLIKGGWSGEVSCFEQFRLPAFREERPINRDTEFILSSIFARYWNWTRKTKINPGHADSKQFAAAIYSDYKKKGITAAIRATAPTATRRIYVPRRYKAGSGPHAKALPAVKMMLDIVCNARRTTTDLFNIVWDLWRIFMGPGFRIKGSGPFGAPVFTAQEVHGRSFKIWRVSGALVNFGEEVDREAALIKMKIKAMDPTSYNPLLKVALGLEKVVRGIRLDRERHSPKDLSQLNRFERQMHALTKLCIAWLLHQLIKANQRLARYERRERRVPAEIAAVMIGMEHREEMTVVKDQPIPEIETLRAVQLRYRYRL